MKKETITHTWMTWMIFTSIRFMKEAKPNDMGYMASFGWISKIRITNLCDINQNSDYLYSG